VQGGLGRTCLRSSSHEPRIGADNTWLRVQGVGFELRVEGSEKQVSGCETKRQSVDFVRRVQVSGFRGQCGRLGSRVQGAGVWVQGGGFRAEG
jgi:hypothetical protein